LLELRARLRGDVSAMAENALRRNRADGNGELSSMPLHMADIGSDNFEQEFTLSLMANEEDTLQLIEAALERIEDGVYGACDECGGVIPKTRLNAIPYTPYCVKCAEKLQR
jgi:RNA polymerase-binding transcription factor DksA